MTEITAIGGVNFLTQKCLGFDVPSLLEAFATGCTKTLRGAKSRNHVGCGDVARVGTSRDGRASHRSNLHVFTPSHLQSFASAWLASRWSEVGICNRIDETAKGSFTLRQGKGASGQDGLHWDAASRHASCFGAITPMDSVELRESMGPKGYTCQHERLVLRMHGVCVDRC